MSTKKTPSGKRSAPASGLSIDERFKKYGVAKKVVNGALVSVPRTTEPHPPRIDQGGGEQQQAPSLAQRIAHATSAAAETLIVSPEAAARYAHTDAVRQFLGRESSPATRNSDASSAQSSSSTTTTAAAELSSSSRGAGGVRRSGSDVSANDAASTTVQSAARPTRIDEIIMGNRNQERGTNAQINATRKAVVQTGATPGGVIEVGRDLNGRQLTVTTLSETLDAVLNTLDNLDGDLFRRPLQVNGLSEEVSNPRYGDLVAERDARIAELNDRIADRTYLETVAAFKEASSAAEIAERRDALLTHLQLYESIESVQLFKPPSIVRELNRRWRELLGAVLLRVAKAFEDTTRESLAAANTNAEMPVAPGALSFYMSEVRDTALNPYVDELRASTFEDMPLTEEVLMDYFQRFITLVAKQLINEQLTNSEQALAQIRRNQFEAATRVYSLGLHESSVSILNQLLPPAGGAVAALGDVNGGGVADFIDEDHEYRILVGYIKDALSIHANEVYEQWLERWIADVSGREPELFNEAILAALRTAVRSLVEAQERVYNERLRALGRSFPRVAPPRESEMAEAYAELLLNEVSFRRAKMHVGLEEDNEVASSFQAFLRGRQDHIPIGVLLHPRADRVEILAAQRSIAERDLRDTYTWAPNAEERAIAFQQNALDNALNTLLERFTLALKQLNMFAPLRAARIATHGPSDPDTLVALPDKALWSRYDLSYPLDYTKTSHQYPLLQSLLSTQASAFDPAGRHATNTALRATLSYNYAARVLQREIMRLNYEIEVLGQPTVPVALVETLDATATQSELNLWAEIDIRDELKIAMAAPERLRRDPRLDNLARDLQTASFDVVWFFRPRYNSAGELDVTQLERVVARETLPPGERRSWILLTPGRTTIPLGGYYRVEFTLRGGGGGGNGDGDDGGGALAPEAAVPYESRFAANIRIMSQCARDNVEYEIGTDSYHECSWLEYPRSEETQRVVGELVRFVTFRGEEPEVDKLIEQFSSVVINRVASMSKRAFFTPPWKADNEQDLLAALAVSHTHEFREKFRYKVIVGNIVARIGAQVRTVLAPYQEELAAFLRGLTDMGLFALLVDAAFVPGMPMERAARLVALANAATSQWSDPALAINAPANNVDGLGGYDWGLILSTAASNDGALLLERVTELERGTDEQLPPVLPTDVFQTQRYSKYVLFDRVPAVTVDMANGSSPEGIPLISMLYALHTPTIWNNLSVNERVFANELFDRFERFAVEYRFREFTADGVIERLLDPTRTESSSSPMQPYVPTRAAYGGTWIHNHGASDYFEAEKHIRDPRLEIEISSELAHMRPSEVSELAADWAAESGNGTGIGGGGSGGGSRYAVSNEVFSDILLDRVLLEMFEKRIDTLERRGLVRLTQADVYDLTTDETRRLNFRVPRDIAFDAPDHFAIGGVKPQGRPKWTGKHSFETVQPDLYKVVIIVGEQAFVEQRGSSPLSTGWDFDGLHEMIVKACNHYNALVREPPRVVAPETRSTLLARVAEKIRMLALLFNFLSLVAFHRPASERISAADLLAQLPNNARILEFLATLVPPSLLAV